MTPNDSIRRGLKSKAFRQRGISLIELMISLVLGLLVIAAVYQIYSANLRSSRMQNALSEVQENGRFALEILRRDVRQSGYRGSCVIDSPTTNHLNKRAKGYEPGLFELEAGIEGWDNDGGLYESDLKKYITGTDVVLIKHFATPTGAVPSDTLGTNSEDIAVVGAQGVRKGAILVIADATACDIFQNTQESHTSPFSRSAKGVLPGNKDPGSSPLNKSYDANAQVMRFGSSIYYLGESDYENEAEAASEDKTTALRRRSYSHGTEVAGYPSVGDEELISGVVDMQVSYGVDTSDNGQVDKYVAANSPDIDDDWSKVLAVSFHLLLRAKDKKILLEPASLSFAGSTFNAASDDLRLYQAFTTTVGIRNRLP